jgi:hypothetical protein
MWRTVTLATLSLLSATPCRAACHIDHFKFLYGSDTTATMHVSSGGRCTINLVLGHTGSIKSIQVAERAKHGSASYNGGIAYPEIAYQSSHGYKGEDAFAFTVDGQGRLPKRSLNHSCFRRRQIAEIRSAMQRERSQPITRRFAGG